MTETPLGPSGVWLEYADGTRYENLPTIYLGQDDEGIEMFEVIPPREESPTSMGAATFPGKTALGFPPLEPRS